ncbi:Connectin [Eumeta japonica]|uniref:Connectin n=1 Tax=Eumeta variegata TaxID=151549 RepID=A0A4C1TL79_EUMVA|nr:Connectin [Eumeta japonica]
MDLKYFVLMITLACVEINLTESRQNDKRRWKNEKSYNSHYVNICDIQDRGSKVHCYCESTKMKTATRADCWVFNGGIAEDDPFWSNFYSQPKIERLSFNVRADGGLTFIPAKVIVRLDRLQYLNIQYANIHIIPSFAFTNSTTLREITLQKNKITKLDKMAFAHLIMLINVSLVENQITELNRDVFYVLPNLQKLHLSKNSISILHDGCFSQLSNLIELDLDNNLISILVRENFQGLSALLRLDMRSNKLRLIGDLAFAELWSLQELYLDKNEIEIIMERGFGGLTQLRKLSLANNKLTSLDDGVLDEIQKLIYLDLRNNDFDTLPYEAIENVVDNMKSNFAVFYLDGNRLTCDCRLSWIHKLRNDTKSKRVRSALDRITCVSGEDLKRNPDGAAAETTTELKYDMTIFGKESPYNREVYDKNYDDLDDEPDDKMYEDTPLDRDEPVRLKAEHRTNLLQIPLNALPCPRKLIHTASYSPPTQDETKPLDLQPFTLTQRELDALNDGFVTLQERIGKAHLKMPQYGAF